MSAINDPMAAAVAEEGVTVPTIDIDVTKLNALSPEVINNQATVGAMRGCARASPAMELNACWHTRTSLPSH
jgi:hypothetical protein